MERSSRSRPARRTRTTGAASTPRSTSSRSQTAPWPAAKPKTNAIAPLKKDKGSTASDAPGPSTMPTARLAERRRRAERRRQVIAQCQGPEAVDSGGRRAPAREARRRKYGAGAFQEWGIFAQPSEQDEVRLGEQQRRRNDQPSKWCRSSPVAKAASPRGCTRATANGANGRGTRSSGRRTSRARSGSSRGAHPEDGKEIVGPLPPHLREDVQGAICVERGVAHGEERAHIIAVAQGSVRERRGSESRRGWCAADAASAFRGRASPPARHRLLCS